jgi:hypothetical protein
LLDILLRIQLPGMWENEMSRKSSDLCNPCVVNYKVYNHVVILWQKDVFGKDS